MIEIHTQCRGCPTLSRTQVNETHLEKYMQRIGLIQELFPHHTNDQREAILGYRTGWYLCPTCWEKELGPEE